MNAPPVELPTSPLKLPVFRAVWIASLTSNLGGLVQAVGASWMMTSLTSSTHLVALVQAASFLPIVLLSLAAGAVADNLDRRLVLLWSQAGTLVLSVALSVFAWMGHITPVTLLGFTFLIACATAFKNPAWQASVGDMVPRASLPSAVALNSMNFNIARTVGPAIGGIIVATAGAAAAFLVNAIGNIALIFVLFRWRPNRQLNSLPRERLDHAMLAGVRYVALSSNISIVMLRAIAFGSAASAVPALMPVIARDMMGGGALTFGVLLSAFGFGAVAGATASARLRRRYSIELIARVSTLAVAAGALAVGLSGALPAAVPALVLVGGGWVLAFSTFNVTVQLATPRWVVGRALALYQMALFAGMTIGSWAFGVLAERYNVGTALIASATWQIAGLLLGLRARLPSVEHLDLDPVENWRAPELDVRPRSGPIVITIEYLIAEQSLVAFLTAMDERRRIRRRDGARHWTLLRDLAKPARWIERYDVPTWVEYIRHNQRRTHADAENSDRLLTLHQGVKAPRIERLIERQTYSVHNIEHTLIEPTT